MKRCWHLGLCALQPSWFFQSDDNVLSWPVTLGTFYAKYKLENVLDRNKSVVLSKMLVDTGSEYTWAPAQSLEKIGIDREKKDVPFVMANGQQITRSVGFAIIRLDKHFTVDEVVFAEKGDLLLLGARSLEGLNLRVIPVAGNL